MVHRNTEYKLKFYFPNEELSKKIWLDNIKFRKSRRAMNLADNFWDFQVSCDCEACHATRVKFDGITSQSTEEKEKKNTSTEFKDADVPEVSCREAKTQTPKWITYPHRASSHSSNVPTPKKDISRPENEKRPVILKKKNYTSLTQRCKRNVPTPVTSQNLIPRSSLFLPYGWNDDTKNIGDKKTFNVLAPQKEVHDTALMALWRNCDLEKSRHSRQVKMKQKSASLLSLPRLNHSSIWMTEYRDKFSKG